ncbi:putative membrane protein YlbC [Lysinibacillus alkalisoli]|uniref:Membrane protein YlbC n=1 Tax=Lysinibacillus alkalisoli TaxID=1911548 RepID=A0A917G397_9BACI|nr:CAP-associated domain-containing protein [Lysinibacillus alkalisoli]GGG20848.1 putative membrane protein YlbC [Lysinibacillus alkalisoli]
MKALFRILLIMTIATFIFYKYSQNKEQPPVQDQAPTLEMQIHASTALPRPKEGVSTLIGKDEATLIEQYGEPIRKEPSAYRYEWWVYNKNPDEFMMVALLDKEVKQVFVAGREVATAPFEINSTLEEVYRTTIIEPEVMLSVEDTLYTFALTDDDLSERLLVKFEDVVAQIFVNTKNKVTGIRFFDYETLVKLHPYDITYFDTIVDRPRTKLALKGDVTKAVNKQILDLVNLQRHYKKQKPLKKNEILMQLATMHSEEMVEENYFEKESPTLGNIEERTKSFGYQAEEVDEVIGELMLDPIELVHAWLNDEEQQKILLEGTFTHTGIGCEQDKCTQIVAKPITIPREPSPVELK